ncbi:phage tail protein [Novosphingobium colocasiae]|uniref:Oxidoreductase n=2 Tax=Bacteria TaxID=2 RepID=A0A918PDU9_9SPHN|nr:phage tail protein [Novosphingobium colocasiae]GGZ02597.1 oxidoreductase [Novosphingobium colocasiae]
MATAPVTLPPLMSLGMFVFGMNTWAYSEFQQQMDWRHEKADRFGARAASQFAGPGDDRITLSGLLVPEIAGTYGAIATLEEMAGTGDHWDLIDGQGIIYGAYRIVSLNKAFRGILAGNLPRGVDFTLELERHD